MKSVEGYLPEDPVGSDEGPWAATPVADTAPTNEADHDSGSTASEAEEALELALAEVDKAAEELRGMEELHDRLRARLQDASAEADSLITRVSDSYAHEQTRLEVELGLIQEQVSSLARIRETLPREGIATSPGTRAPAEPDPLVLTVDPDPDPEPDPKAEPEPASAPVVVAVPSVFAPVGKNGDRKASQQGAEGPRPTYAVNTRPATDQDPAGEDGAYEDHWYQVLRQDNSLGGDPA